MRTAPDKDRHLAVTDRDVDSSNATLNTLFGGARQKSWMTGLGAPVRPTPRTSISRTAVPQVTSPQKTNTVQPSTQRPQSSKNPAHAATVNGSRTEPARPPQNDGDQRPAPNARQFTSGSPSVLSIALDTRSTEPRAEPTSPSAHFLRNEVPGGESVEIRDSASPFEIYPAPLPTAMGGHESTRISQPLQSPALSEPAVTQGPPLRQASIVSAPSSLPTTEQQSALQEAQNQNLGSGRMHISSPRIPSRTTTSASTMQLQYQPPSPPSATPSHPNKRQRTAVPTMPSLKPRLALINAHIASVGGAQNLNNGLERPRFQLLLDACNNEDAFYVALHQLFCTWDVSRHDLADIVLLPPGSIMILAFRIVGHLIRDNEGLAPNHLKWFVQFPSPMNDLLRTSEPYRRVMSDVGIFLSRLASDWAQLSKQCSTRGYPPLVDELVNTLGLLSPILQQVVFTATRRNLGIVDDRYGQEMESVFLQDRKAHQELAVRYNTARPPTQKEVTERNSRLIERYLLLRNLHRQLPSQLSGVSVGSPLAQPGTLYSNVGGQPSNNLALSSSNRSSMSENQVAWAQNEQGPDLSSSWEGASRLPSSGSPNPTLITATARPSSVLSQRPYENTPSPTFMQNLSIQSPSVQSPVQQPFHWPSTVLRSHDPLMQPTQNPQTYPTENRNGVSHQNPAQNFHQRTHNPEQHQYAVQQQQQQQQQQLRQQHVLAAQNPPQQQWQQIMTYHQQQQLQLQQQQVAPYMQPHQLQQQALQHQQHQIALQQQVLGMNRTAQLRSNSISAPQQRAQSRSSGAARPSPNGSAQTTPPQGNQMPLNAYAQLVSTRNVNRSLVPPLDFMYPAQLPTPDTTALHQAHVRSPRLVPADFEPSDGAEVDLARRFYQVVREFAMVPVKLPLNGTLSKFDFMVSEQDFSLIANDTHRATDRLPVRQYRQGTIQYRLRCIQTKPDVTTCLTPDWVVSDTSWPESIFMEINDRHLDIRRKTQHGKDLPIDVTRFVLQAETHHGSSHRLKISVPRQRKGQKELAYFIAVEIIEILQHQQILDRLMKHQHLPASTTLAAIKKSLAVSDDDDEVAMVMSDLSVDLADPFTARIFDVPVRGMSCLHRECFDLETFLLTRNSKPKRPSQPCMVDVWKCPLCSKDSRPSSLQIVDYLADVRATLAEEDKLEVKAILISADGSWKPKPEAMPLKRKATNGLDIDDDSTDDESGKNQKIPQPRRGSVQTNVNSRRQGTQGPIEIIDLDD